MKRMKNWKTPKPFCLLLLAVMLFSPYGNSCGPFFPNAIFVFGTHPGKPLKWYADGSLGVVLPDYNRSYLVIAYRYFAGRPLAESERNDALNYWRGALGRSWNPEEDKSKDPLLDWLAARRQILGAEAAAPAISADQQVPGGYGNFTNCLDDAFRTAALTLRDRASRFGNDRPAIQEWVQAQDMVFSDCDHGQGIPPVAKDSSPAWLKSDRQYQVAAAYFYVHSFDEAAQQFDQIARDSGSPWRKLAPYLAARSMIRKATMPEKLDQEALQNAESRLQKIVADPSNIGMQKAARAMLGFVSLRLHPEQRTAELAQLLAGPQPDPNFYQDLVDYAWGSGQATGDDPEITDWIFTFQQKGDDARAHALARWRKQHSLPWLVAALSKIDSKDAAAGDLLRAAEQAPASSPAYATVAYHRIRLLMQAGAVDKARSVLEGILKSTPVRLTDSSLNLFLGHRAQLATSYQDFLAHAALPVIDIDDGIDSRETFACEPKSCDEVLYGGADKPAVQWRFDRNSAWILNLRTPLTLLADAAKSNELHQSLRGEVALAAWTRAEMLNRHDIAAALAPELEKAYPAVKEQMEAYAAAKPEDAKQAGLFAILHFPGMRPYVNSGVARSTAIEKVDDFRDNWWCADVGTEVDQVNRAKDESLWAKAHKITIPKDAPAAPSFFSPEQQKAADREWQELVASGAGPSYLAREAMAWATAQPQDPRVPEALHLAVRSTRYGCSDDMTSNLSHKAFTLLHEKYPNSKWAKLTPYWY